MNIYTKDGWLNAEHVEEVADRNNISFIVIIGKRQIGKTYGVLKLMLDKDKRFILLRGMRTELEVLERNVNSPFEKIHGYEGRIAQDTDFRGPDPCHGSQEAPDQDPVPRQGFPL